MQHTSFAISYTLRSLHMLDKFKKLLFTQHEKQSSIAPELSEYEHTSNSFFLTDQKKIIQLLKDLEEASPLCTITIKGITEQFSSSILDVQIDNKQIILDELSPRHGHELLINQNKLKLITIYNGIRLAFNLSGIKTGSSHGIAYYKSFIPNRIYYPQRRSFTRTIINYDQITFSGISSRNQATVGGKIFDISTVGVGVCLPSNRARFQRGDSVKNCTINLNGHIMNFDLAVRFVKKNNQGNDKTQIGGYFENISTEDKNKLRGFVMTLEQEENRITKPTE